MNRIIIQKRNHKYFRYHSVCGSGSQAVTSAQMAFDTAAAVRVFKRDGRAAAAPTGPCGPDGYLANTRYVIRNRQLN